MFLLTRGDSFAPCGSQTLNAASEVPYRASAPHRCSGKIRTKLSAVGSICGLEYFRQTRDDKGDVVVTTGAKSLGGETADSRVWIGGLAQHVAEGIIRDHVGEAVGAYQQHFAGCERSIGVD